MAKNLVITISLFKCGNGLIPAISNWSYNPTYFLYNLNEKLHKNKLSMNKWTRI